MTELNLCSKCGAQQHFDQKQSALKCEFCGTETKITKPQDKSKKKAVYLGFLPLVLAIVNFVFVLNFFGYDAANVYTIIGFATAVIYALLKRYQLIVHFQNFRNSSLTQSIASSENISSLTDEEKAKLILSYSDIKKPFFADTSKDKIMIPLVTLVSLTFISIAIPLRDKLPTTHNSVVSNINDDAKQADSSSPSESSVTLSPVDESIPVSESASEVNVQPTDDERHKLTANAHNFAAPERSLKQTDETINNSQKNVLESDTQKNIDKNINKLNRAENALNMNDYGTAKSLAREVLEKSPDNSQAKRIIRKAEAGETKAFNDMVIK